MEKISIEGNPGLSGEISTTEEDFLGLKCGTKIIKIGTGKATGCNRVDTFSYPVTYVGSIVIDDTKYYAFKLDSKVSGEGNDYYVLYESTGSEVYSCRNGKNNFFFKPVFEVVE